MHGPPTDLSEAELRTALVAGWRIEPSSIAYAPVGFGSHHWIIVESASRRWFVTADTVDDSSTRLADLSAALRTTLDFATRRRTRVRTGTCSADQRRPAAGVGAVRHRRLSLSGRDR